MATPDVTSINPSTGNPWQPGDIFVDTDGTNYVYTGPVGTGQFVKTTVTPGGQSSTGDTGETTEDTTVYDSQPNVLFEKEPGKTTYDPGTGKVAETAGVTEPKSWYQALSFLSGLRGKEDQTEYNRYVNALKKTPFWADNKSVEGAYKDALYSAAAQGISIQELLFKRKFTGVEGTTEGTAKANSLKSYKRVIERSAIDQGVTLTPGLVDSIATMAISQGWDSATIQEEVARRGKVSFEKGGKGVAAKYYSDLKDFGAQYGVNYNDAWYQQAALSILQGKSSPEDWKADIKEYSKLIYPVYAKQIDANVSPLAQASPYIRSMANILEISPDTISLSDPTISKALTSVDAEGNPTLVPLWQFERDLRKNDPRWKYTKNAEEAMMSASRKVLQDFGLVS